MLVLSEISHLSDSLVLLLEAHSAHLHQARELLSALTAGLELGCNARESCSSLSAPLAVLADSCQCMFSTRHGNVCQWCVFWL